MIRLNKRESALKKKLDHHYKFFDYSQISPDPLEFPHRFTNYYDIEISAFISSVFAYGNVKQIINSLEKIHVVMKNKPYEFVMKYSYERGIRQFKSVKHRFFTGEDIAKLFYALNRIYKNYGSLKYFFLLYYFDRDENFKNAVSFFSQNLIQIISAKGKISHGIKFMIPDPVKGSTCKRMNLFLRWVVRKDHLDFGIWNEITPSKLIIPVDTHVAKICRMIGLTAQKNANWKMAEEITRRLKKFDPDDPVKYDFAICHLGMRKLKF